MSRAIDVAMKQAEQIHERELNSRLGQKMNAVSREGETGDGMKNTVLGYVAGESYERAIEELKAYVESKSEFPQFAARVERYLSHSCDLINAIKAKRSFPGLGLLTMSKQQDLYDKAMGHFDELKHALQKIERTYNDVRLEDLRSTVWVIKATVYGCFGIMLVGFMIELSRGVVGAALTLVDSGFSEIVNTVFEKLGL
jgi:hypothetical protein